ncbi:MAG: hypothetical protein JW768_10535 [Chitinispirillaceae bacterium]|nr:hypothetical protein [Chitinispirillaceae bacterium]
MNSRYLLFRIFRRIVPFRVSDFLLRRNIGLKISMGTTDPARVVREYIQELNRISQTVRNALIMEIGYGGSFGTAIEFLKNGARHVYLHDEFVRPATRVNTLLMDDSGGYLTLQKGIPCPDPRHITLLPRDNGAWRFIQGSVDFVVSRAVLEHVADVSALLNRLLGHEALRAAVHAHFIDMRDHYFAYPYEMLCYREAVWKALLCPAEHLNRLRLHQYHQIFKKHFDHCEYRITDTDPVGFFQVKNRIQKQFLCGDNACDAALRAWVLAW